MDFTLDHFSVPHNNKLIAFDMDNTILKYRFIDICAEKFGFKKELLNIRSSQNNAIVRSKRIATLLQGIALSDLIDTAENIPLIEDAAQVVSELKNR